MTPDRPPTHAVVPSAAELGFRSELIFHRADGEVIDLRAEHGCRLIRTPGNPTYYWGNYLLFDRAPRAGDAQRWEPLFERLIERRQPLSTHRAFGWIEDAAGEIGDFLAAGYTRNDAAVMQTARVPVVPSPTLIAQLRPLALDGEDAEREWSALINLSVATRDPRHDELGYREFARLSVARWRALAEARQGHWFGAFVDDAAGPRLVAALGLYVEAGRQDGERLARFQSVMTDTAYRRRGLCRALIAAATQHVRDAFAADRFIIVAAAGEMPEQLYASVGFFTAGMQRGVQRMSAPGPSEGD
jgi:GNAT superfamily N-acetyltransferase